MQKIIHYRFQSIEKFWICKLFSKIKKIDYGLLDDNIEIFYEAGSVVSS
ncbi:MAG: hypothetical protein CM15mP123_06410 [Gammaproteobacteria bacterium]|nr:MAG: hypothetical protein CM15mP123_06410 [Gammaproteobacteria bacterium]